MISAPAPPHVAVVGPGTRFLSGVTCYTFVLCNRLSESCIVSAILMRRLLPARLYPGRERVGAPLSDLSLLPAVRRYDGVDWFWGVTMARALIFLARQRPDVLLLQWWTGTVLHTYLALALTARLLGIRVVVEVHEALDPGEDRLRLVNRYVGAVAPWLFRLAAGYVVHSAHDRDLVAARYGTAGPGKPVEIIPFATWDHYRGPNRVRLAPEGCCNLLFFGLIRPYKGLDTLIRAFDSIQPEEIDRYWLTVVGETWEGWTEPMELVERSPYRDRISVDNRYVTDREVGAYFNGADVVVLPYHRSCGSGALHVALNHGLPVVVTPMEALVEAVDGYGGAVVAAEATPPALLEAIRGAAGLRGRRFADPRPWSDIPRRYHDFFARLDGASDDRRQENSPRSRASNPRRRRADAGKTPATRSRTCVSRVTRVTREGAAR